jgi:hypothetical protein
VVEKIAITVRASGAHPDVLTVQDAMRQVLDIFELLSAGANGSQGVEWKLSKATTNSPFHLEGEAVSFAPAVDVSVIARIQKNDLAEGLREIAGGSVPEGWQPKQFEIAKRLYRRNLNGVGATVVDFESGAPVLVTPSLAEKAIQTLEAKIAPSLYDFPIGREEIGTVDGTFANLSPYRNNPALAILDSRTGRTIWCLLSDDLQAKLTDKARYEDFWKHSRVMVSGRIRYDKSGQISLVNALDVQRIESRSVNASAIRDNNFTSGLSTSEYLDKFRDGALGQ